MGDCGLVLGFFDGVHAAHRAVIESALKNNRHVKLITFKESPAAYFTGKQNYILSRLNSLNKLKSLGISEIVELNFSDICKMTAEEYLQFLVNMYHPTHITTGFNHTFGFNKTGNPEFLEYNQSKYNYKYTCVPPVVENNEIVSSSLIRNYLSNGNISVANSLLESNFILEGIVEHGAKLGRTIGFPTANIRYPNDIVQIPYGVYASSVYIRGVKKTAILNWGMKPTVHNTKEPVVEVHILDFSEDIYGMNISVEVLNRLRGEQKFNNIDELKNQIKKDIELCLMS